MSHRAEHELPQSRVLRNVPKDNIQASAMGDDPSAKSLNHNFGVYFSFGCMLVILNVLMYMLHLNVCQSF